MRPRFLRLVAPWFSKMKEPRENRHRDSGVDGGSGPLVPAPDLLAELVHRHGVIDALVVAGDHVEIIEAEPVLRTRAVLEGPRDGARSRRLSRGGRDPE